jgi:hypothetical protein
MLACSANTKKRQTDFGETMRFFNTNGTCDPSEHYMLPPLPRVDGVDELIEKKLYFVLHAPHQSGKTTYLKALTEKINSGGQYYAVNCSLSSLRTTHDEEKAMGKVVAQVNAGLLSSKDEGLKKLAYAFSSRPYMADADIRVRFMLNDLCQALDRELVVFFDEADCLLEDPLVTFLSQIRDGYLYRSDSPGTRFPRSMALVGMRDIRDYMSRVRPDEMSTGTASPFNIKKESFTLANFTREEIGSLYGQHTAETGQAFEPAAIDRAWHWSEGQPWLVCALADETVVRQLENDCSRTVSMTAIDLAAQALILRR